MSESSTIVTGAVRLPHVASSSSMGITASASLDAGGALGAGAADEEAVGLGLGRLAVERGLELRHVEAELPGVLLGRLSLQPFAALPAIEQVVHLPEAVGALLLVRLPRRLRGERRVGVHRERQVLPHEV